MTNSFIQQIIITPKLTFIFTVNFASKSQQIRALLGGRVNWICGAGAPVSGETQEFIRVCFGANFAQVRYLKLVNLRLELILKYGKLILSTSIIKHSS